MGQASIETLRGWSQILLWVTILVLPLLMIAAGSARAYIERRISQLTAAATDAEFARLRDTVATRHVTAEQRAKMLPVLAALKGQGVAVACRMLDGESCDFAVEIAAVFSDAGCVVPDVIKMSLNDFAGYTAIAAHGQSDPHTLQTVKAALDAAGIPSKVQDVSEGSVGRWYPDVVHVVVGRKR